MPGLSIRHLQNLQISQKCCLPTVKLKRTENCALGYFTADLGGTGSQSFIFRESKPVEAQEEGPQAIINILKPKRGFPLQQANTSRKESCVWPGTLEESSVSCWQLGTPVIKILRIICFVKWVTCSILIYTLLWYSTIPLPDLERHINGFF